MKRLIAPLAALFAFAGIAFAQPTAPPRLTTATAPHAVWIGDSITANSNFVSLPNNSLSEQLNGYTTWTKLLTGYRINTQLSVDNFAVGGFTTGQMLSELPAAIAQKPDICIVHGGRNDSLVTPSLPDTTPGTITANLRQIYDQLQAANCVVFAIKVLSNNSFLNLQSKQKMFQVNQWIEQQKLTRKGFYVIDAGATFDDPTNTTAWAPRNHYVEDGTHPSIWGAYVLGLQLATQINTLWPNWRLRLQNVDDAYDAVNNPTGDILTNHMFVGAGGVANNGATGAVAAGWTLSGFFAIGATVVGSQTTTTDGRQAQTVTISGTANGATGRVLLTQLINVANLTQGDTIECSMDANWGSTTNITDVQLIFQSNEGPGNFNFTGVGQSGAVNTNLGYTLPTNVGGPVASISVPLYTPRRTIMTPPTTVGGQSALFVQIDFLNPIVSSAVAGTFQFASPSCRKILPVTTP